MSKFTFKKEPRETGLASIGKPNPNTAIKHDKKVVGAICGPNWKRNDGWLIRLMVKQGNSFKWIRLKFRPKTEPEARAFLQEHADLILRTYELYHEELD